MLLKVDWLLYVLKTDHPCWTSQSLTSWGLYIVTFWLLKPKKTGKHFSLCNCTPYLTCYRGNYLQANNAFHTSKITTSRVFSITKTECMFYTSNWTSILQCQMTKCDLLLKFSRPSYQLVLYKALCLTHFS